MPSDAKGIDIILPLNTAGLLIVFRVCESSV